MDKLSLKNKKIYIRLFIALGILLLIFVVWILVKLSGDEVTSDVIDIAVACSYEPGAPGAKEEVMNNSMITLEGFADNLTSGGPPPDGIPPVDVPKYISIADSEAFLDDADPVFFVESREGVKIYPQKILVWHEIVNDTFDGVQSSLTYCPLTGTVIGYRGTFENQTTTFGTSGKLVNSNLVMYDRATNSNWPQILGQAVDGESKGEKLEVFPVQWSNWRLAKVAFPNAMVLSKDTGYLRSYGNDPYGSYAKSNSYYNSGKPFFPLLNDDDRLEPKEVVIGVIGENAKLAILKSQVQSERVVNTTVGDQPVVAIHDCTLDTVRVYSRIVNGEEMTFSFENGAVKDQNGRVWSVKGLSNGTQLDWVTSFDAMWFSWAAYYPSTELYR